MADRFDKLQNSVEAISNNISDASKTQNSLLTAQLGSQLAVAGEIQQVNQALRAQIGEMQSANNHLSNLENLQEAENSYLSSIESQAKLISTNLFELSEKHNHTNELLDGLIEQTKDGFREITEQEKINNRYNWDRWLDGPQGQLFQQWLPGAQEYIMATIRE